MKEKRIINFGVGYRKFELVRSIDSCPVCSSSEPDITPEILTTEQFRIETLGEADDPDKCIRIRSDVSILLHAADMSKKYGLSTMQSFMDSKRPKISSIQTQMDELSDKQILDTIKSRHLQSPAELLAWSEYLNEQARLLELEASEKNATEKDTVEKAAALNTDSGTDSSSEAGKIE